MAIRRRLRGATGLPDMAAVTVGRLRPAADAKSAWLQPRRANSSFSRSEFSGTPTCPPCFEVDQSCTLQVVACETAWTSNRGTRANTAVASSGRWGEGWDD